MAFSGIKLERFSALMNGVFVGVGIIFLIWGGTDIAFPITERANEAVFGLLRIILGIISLSVGVGIESVRWAKMGNEVEKEPVKEEAKAETPPQQKPEQSAPKPQEEPAQREPEQQAPPPQVPPQAPSPQSQPSPEITQPTFQ